MVPSALPQQRIVGLPDDFQRPEPFESVIGNDEKPPGVRYPRGPYDPEYLGQVEWASDLIRVVAFYLHRGRRHWVLWERWYDDNWETWEWTSVGYVPREQASFREAAIHLLIDYWRDQRSKCRLERYGWVNETGYFRAAEWRMLGLSVWPEVSKQSASQGD